MAVKRDDVSVVVMVDGKQAVNQLGELEMKSRDLKASLKDMKKGTEEYIQANKQLDKVTADVKQLRTELGLEGMTLQQLRNYQRDLNREYSNVTIGTQRHEELKNKLQEVNGVIAKQATAVKQVGDAAKQSGGFMNSFMGSFVAGLAQQALSSVISFGKESIAAFQESQQATAQLESSLASTGGAAGITKHEITSLSTELQKLTNIDDDVTNSAASLLLTFTEVKNKAFKEAIPLIQDLAVKMAGGSGGEIDLKSATIQVGKALNDPIKGVTALSKVGVSFTEQQKAQIKTLQQSGDMYGAQAIILRELEKEFGGSARAAAIAQGGMGKLKVVSGELSEELGERLMPAVDELSDAGIALAENLDPLFHTIESSVTPIRNLWESIGRLITTFVPLGDKASGASTMMKALSFAINLLLAPIKLAYTGITAWIDSMILLINVGKQVANFFGADFEPDISGSWKKLTGNIVSNSEAIMDSYKGISKGAVAAAATIKKANEDAAKAKSETVKKEADEEINYRKLTMAQLKAINDDGAKEEIARRKKIAADMKKEADQHRKEQEAAHKKHLDNLRKAEDDYEKHLKDEQKKNDAAVKAGRAAEEAYDREMATKAFNAKMAINDLEIMRAQGRRGKLLQIHLERLELEKQRELDNAEQTGASKEVIEAKYAEKEKQLRQQNFTQNFQQVAQFAQQAITEIQGFVDLHFQKQIQGEESNKNKRLATLNLELKEKRITQAQYDKQTAAIIADEDGKIRALKTKQAKADKEAAIAQAVIAGALAVVSNLRYGPAMAVLAGITSAISIAKIIATPIPKFADGGFTSFAGGGHVGSARLGLIGEAGPEYVISNPMLKNPKVANFVSVLESMRGARAFADGGFTTTDLLNTNRIPLTPETNNLASAPNPANQNSGGTDAQGNRQVVAELQNIANEIKNLQGRLKVFYTDIEEVAAQVNKVRIESTIS